MKKCPYCGFNNPDSATVCINCGKSLLEVDSDDFTFPREETSYVEEKKEEFLKRSHQTFLPLWGDLLIYIAGLLIIAILLYFTFKGDLQKAILFSSLIMGFFFYVVEFFFTGFTGKTAGENLIVESGVSLTGRVVWIIFWGASGVVLYLILLFSPVK